MLHRILILKLEKYGVKGDLLLWIENFLQDRQQRVTIGDSLSDWKPVTIGIPQGSVLGQILFLIYVNDLQGVIDCCFKSFAADAKMYVSARKYKQINFRVMSITQKPGPISGECSLTTKM